MLRSLQGRAAARLRRGLGFERLQERLDQLELQLSAVQQRLTAAELRPHGPVYLGGHRAVVATRWGAKMVVDTSDELVAPWLLLDGLWETHVTGWMNDTLKPGDVMVDVGANVGYFTLLAAQKVGAAGRVIAVEAHPSAYEVLRHNVILNGHLPTVTLWNRAAWSIPAELTFHQRVRSSASSSLATGGADALEALGDTEQVVAVQAVPLDELLQDAPRVNVIKIDIEGAEVQALRGLTETLARNPDMQVLFEWFPSQIRKMGDDPEELLRLLAGAGFHFRVLDHAPDFESAVTDPTQLLQLEYGNVVASR
ncbi:MAG: FkbM family methyltransferase [Acidimicrobiales bacterium]|nr:FkbM family methyltransferase [Acidimicrobiales bacterium]